MRVGKERVTTVDLVVSGSLRVRGGMHIVAICEGDFMAAAGVDWAVSRESNDACGQAVKRGRFSPRHKPTIERDVAGPDGCRGDRRGHWDPEQPIGLYKIESSPCSGLLPLISADEVGLSERAAPGIQALFYRHFLNRNPGNRLPAEWPQGLRPGKLQNRGTLQPRVRSGSGRQGLPGAVKVRFGSRRPSSAATPRLPAAALAGLAQLGPGQSASNARRGPCCRGLLRLLPTGGRVPPRLVGQMVEFALCRNEFQKARG